MKKEIHLSFRLWLFVLLCMGQSVIACKYNVRDMGFVDMEDRPYLLNLYLNSSFVESDIQNMTRFLQAQLKGTNIRGQAVHRVLQKSHPALSWLKDADTGSGCQLLLINPAGQPYPVWNLDKEKNIEQQIRSVITWILTSPMRSAIQEKSLKIFGVVLLIEGRREHENERARQAAQDAINRIEQAMGTLPKPIAHPPELMTLPWQDRPGESLLLWSQGLEDGSVVEPSIIVLYGRLRRMGPVLSGVEISTDKITSLLSVIGADCECGLDRSWLQGEMMPAQWDSEQLEELVRQLDFDTENPVIKIEMSQILQKGLQDESPAGFEAIKGVHIGYREIEVRFDPPAELQQDDQQEIPAPEETPEVIFSSHTENIVSTEQQVETGEDEFSLWNPLHMVGGIGMVVLVVGVVLIVVRSGRKP